MNIEDDYGLMALTWASSNGHADVVRELLKTNNVDVNHQTADGDTALLCASSHGHTDVVRELLKTNKG